MGGHRARHLDTAGEEEGTDDVRRTLTLQVAEGSPRGALHLVNEVLAAMWGTNREHQWLAVSEDEARH